MKLFSYIGAFLLLISTDLSAESSDLNQYKIELIIFKHLDKQPSESFDQVMDLPSDNIIKFLDKKIEILINYSFDDFWNLYDKKVGKKQPLESKWLKFSDDKRHTIMEYVKNYVNSTPNKKYRKNPQTFFNGEGWNDELINEKNEVKLTDIEWLNL